MARQSGDQDGEEGGNLERREGRWETLVDQLMDALAVGREIQIESSPLDVGWSPLFRSAPSPFQLLQLRVLEQRP